MRTKNLLAFAAATLVLAACNNDEVASDSLLPDDHAIRVTTQVGALQTRAGVETSNLTAFGMFVTNPNANSPYTYANKKWTKAGNDWTCEGLMLWQNATTNVSVLAYAPYNAEITEIKTNQAFAVQADQSATDGSDVVKSDLICAKSAAVSPTTSGTNTDEVYYDADVKALNLTFKHMMAKLKIEVTLGTEFNLIGENNATLGNPITALTLCGSKTTATWDMSDGTITATEETATDITPLALSYANATGMDANAVMTNGVATYECILVPQMIEAGNFFVSMTINGKTYIWAATDTVTLDSGKLYVLKLTVGHEVVNVTGFNAGDWTDSTGSNLTTD